MEKKLRTHFDNLKLDVYKLNNKDFIHGTYRITKPGLYKLTENIIFEPNKNVFVSSSFQDLHNLLDNYRPLDNQLEYSKPPYHLGFFAAITVESDDVVIDLNGYSISQLPLYEKNLGGILLLKTGKTVQEKLGTMV